MLNSSVAQFRFSCEYREKLQRGAVPFLGASIVGSRQAPPFRPALHLRGYVNVVVNKGSAHALMWLQRQRQNDEHPRRATFSSSIAAVRLSTSRHLPLFLADSLARKRALLQLCYACSDILFEH